MNWTDGYVADAEYTSHYFSELSPAHLNFLAITSSVLPPDRNGGRFRYAELGCGNGVSTNLLAAANPEAAFVGIDFMPVHIANARRTAKHGNIKNVEFLELSFADACKQDFEPFDYIVAHGVYSWISPENRAEMVEFFRRFLAPGGLVYLSYNTQPGWLSIAPVQKLVSEYAQTIRGPSTQRVKAGFDFAASLLAKNLGTFVAYPLAKQQIEKAATMAPNYLAQEYLNGSWYPLYVTDVMSELLPAKLDYVCSATVAENDLRYLMTDELAAVVREQPTEELRQLIKDLATNARFRRDIYSRGGRRLSGLDQRQLMAEQLFALNRNASSITLAAEHAGRKISFDSPLAKRLLEELATGPKTLGALGTALSEAGAKDGLRGALEISNALLISGQALPLIDARGEVTNVNRSLSGHALEDSATNALATPWGTGVGIAPMELAMMAVGQPGDDVPSLTKKLTALAARKGRLFTKQGKPITEPSEVEAFLVEEVQRTLNTRWAALQTLGLSYLNA